MGKYADGNLFCDVGYGMTKREAEEHAEYLVKKYEFKRVEYFKIGKHVWETPKGITNYQKH
jgi:hypothetical protein